MNGLTWRFLVVLMVACTLVSGCAPEETPTPAPETEAVKEPADESAGDTVVEPEAEPAEEPEEDSASDSPNTPAPTPPASVTERIEAAPEEGFHWAYYLFIPGSAYPDVTHNDRTLLLVEPNNTGQFTDDYETHDFEAERLVNRRASFAESLEIPLLVPVFPRPEPKTVPAYTHALDAATLEIDDSELVRIDLQLLAMIDDATERLADKGIAVEDKVLMNGFSASAMFVNRFALLHPTEVQAVAMGAPGGWPLAPVGDWEGLTLEYPVGVADMDELVGEPFDAEAFRSVHFYFFMGDHDTNDSVPGPQDRWLGWSKAQAKLIHEEFGDTPVDRWPVAEEMYQSVDSQAEFVVYPGAEHKLNDTMLRDVEAFFEPYMEGG